MKSLYSEKRFGGWSSLVTSDFFTREEDLERVAESGCIGFFTGVESFSAEQIRVYKKRQNFVLPQEEMIRRCLEAGMALHYGLMFNPVEQKVSDFSEELELIVNNHNITLPSFISLAIPLLGTPLFEQNAREGVLFFNLKLRDMDGRTIIYKALDEENDVAEFIRSLRSGFFAKRKLASHALNFYKTYRKSLPSVAMISCLRNTISTGLPMLLGSNSRERTVTNSQYKRTWDARNESLGTLYKPLIPMTTQYQEYFEPLCVTDSGGRLHRKLYDDLG